jgi:molecular chaperone DnaK
VTSEPTVKRIRVRLRATDPHSLAVSFGANLTAESVFLSSSAPIAVGTAVVVELLYTTGELALRGKGHVAWSPSDPTAKGVAIAVEWDPECKTTVDRIIGAQRASTPAAQAASSGRDRLAPAGGTPSPDRDPGSGAPAQVPPTADLVLDTPSSSVPPARQAKVDDLMLDAPAPTPPEPEKIPSEPISTEYRQFGGDTSREAIFPRIPGPMFEREEMEAWDRQSGEVTPLARIELVHRYKSSTQGGDEQAIDINDSGFRRKVGSLGDAVRSKKWKRELPPRDGTVIGIDLGSTNTSAAVAEDGDTRVIPTRKGAMSIPSVVTILPTGKTIVGAPALRMMPIHPEHTVVGAKRLIGRPFHSPIVQQAMKQFQYQIVEGEDGEAAVQIGEHRIALEEISALLLKEVREMVSQSLGSRVNRAVIACPANYTERQREAVRTAGELAGFHVERILIEPAAVALNYGLGKNLTRRRVLIYDLGGGTFDATLMEVERDGFAVIASGGDAFLGGDDFDERVTQILVEQIRELHGVDPSGDMMAMVRLRHAAEQAKRELSAQPVARIHIETFFVRDWAAPPLDLELTRDELEEEVNPLVERTLRLCQEVCARGKIPPSAIDDVILVGGQSHSPIVQRRVGEMFERVPHRDVQPSEAVAVGAAQYAARIGALASLNLVDALPTSIGIGLPGGRFLKLIPRDTPLPIRRTHHVETMRDGQSSIDVAVFQGEDDVVVNNELIGVLRMKDLPLGPAGAVSVEVIFELTEECILRLSAIEEQSGNVVTTDLVTRGTPEEIRQRLGTTSKPETPAPQQSAPESSALLDQSDTHRMEALSDDGDGDGDADGDADGDGMDVLDVSVQRQMSMLDSSETKKMPTLEPLPSEEVPIDELEEDTAEVAPSELGALVEASEPAPVPPEKTLDLAASKKTAETADPVEPPAKTESGLFSWIKTKLGGSKRKAL